MSNIPSLSALRALSLLSVTLMTSVHAQASVSTLIIDSSQSQVTFTPASGIFGCSFGTDGNIDCPVATPKVASLSGQVDVEVVHEHFETGGQIVDRDLIYLNTRNFSAGSLSSAFPVTGAVGIMSGNGFRVSDDPCTLSMDAQCSYTRWDNSSWGAEGTWDGRKLLWNGWSTASSGDSFKYTMTAQMSASPSAVPEPSAAVMFSLGLITLAIGRRRRALA